jgi:hypothetical protein
VEKDVRFETVFIPIAKGLFDQTLDFVVQALNGTISQAMHKESQNVVQVLLAHPRHFLDGL